MRSVYLLIALCLVLGLSGASAATDKPSLAVVAPPNGATINGNNVEISLSFSSSDNSPVSRIKVFLDGKMITERVYDTPVTKGNSGFRWDTTRTPNGNHIVDFQVYAGSEFLGIATVKVSVSNKPLDIMPPKAQIVSPKEGQMVSGVTEIVIDASDNSEVPPMVVVHIDKTFKSASNNPPYIYHWDTANQANGPHSINATAMDESLNKIDTKSVNVIVNNPVEQSKTAALGETPITETKPSIATPEDRSSPAADKVESARTLSNVDSVMPEKFEVAQVAAPKAVTASLSTPRQLPVAKPKMEAPAPAKVVQVAQVPTSLPAVVSKVKQVAKSFVGTIYTVEAGDTVRKLAKKFGVAEQAILASNDIPDVRKIQIGAKLTIPPADNELVNIRPVFENVNGVMLWDANTMSINAVSQQNDVKLKVGSPNATVNSKQVTMDKAAQLRAGRTLVPRSFVTKTLGMAIPK